MTKLIADIGGTNARFATVDANNQVQNIEVFACADYPSLADAALAYNQMHNIHPTDAALAVATPVTGADHVSMTNHTWSFSITETRQKIGLQRLSVINDFTALALSVPHLAPSDYYKVSSNGNPTPFGTIGIIGPGTGLGVSAIAFDENRKPIVIPTEGGHVTMPATTQRDFDIFEHLRQNKYHHISAERVTSGKGLINLYNAICGIDKVTAKDLAPAEIMAQGLNNQCKICAETIDLFCHFLGTTAGNLALSYGATGGIYIAGGIVPKMGDYFKNSRFRESFEAKGRFKDFMSAIPTYVITHPYPGLEGLRYI